MDRRDFSKIILGAGAAGAGLGLPAPAWANLDRDKDPLLSPFGRVRLLLGAQSVIVSWFLIVTSGQWIGLDLRQEMPQFNENRANAADLPLLGGLFRAPLGKRFSGAQLAGRLALYNTMLMLVPSRGDFPAPKSTVIAHGDLSWEAGGRPRPVKMTGLPDVPALAGLPVIGRAFLQPAKRSLLVVIQPSIVQEPGS